MLPDALTVQLQRIDEKLTNLIDRDTDHETRIRALERASIPPWLLTSLSGVGGTGLGAVVASLLQLGGRA